MPDRVVGDRRQVHDGVEAVQVLGADVAHIHGDRLDFGDLTEDATVVETAVEAHDLVSGCLQHRREHRADVAVMAGD